VICGIACLRILKAWGPKDIPRLSGASIDPTVLAFIVGITFLSGVLFGLAPVWQLVRSERTHVLNTESGWSTTRSGHSSKVLV